MCIFLFWTRPLRLVSSRNVPGQKWAAENSHIYGSLPRDGGNVCKAVCWYATHPSHSQHAYLGHRIKTLEKPYIWIKFCLATTRRIRRAVHLQSPQTAEAGGGGAAAFQTVGWRLGRQKRWGFCWSRRDMTHSCSRSSNVKLISIIHLAF